MYVHAVCITLHAPYAMTLKDKRQILRSLLDKVRRQFNVSAAEVDAMDLCQRLVIGVAAVSNSAGHAQAMIEEVVHFIETNADADIVSVEVV